MSEQDYVLGRTSGALESERLSMLERLYGLASRRYLTALGIRKGWHCLEVGAGRGAMAGWMAEQVGPEGRVVATDINTRFLKDLALPNVEVRQHDICADPLESDTYDLAHCSALLAHLPDPLLAARRIIAALKPGGWLMDAEADCSSIRAVDGNHPRAEFFNSKTREIYERIVRSSTTKPFFGCRIRTLLEEAGLTEVVNEGSTRIVKGGEPEATVQCIGFKALMERGLMSQAEFDELRIVYSEPTLSFISLTVFRAWGRRPG